MGDRSPKPPFPSPTLAEEILQAIPTLIVVFNSEGHAVYVTPSIKSILGFEVEEVLGEKYFEVVRSPDIEGRKAVREALMRAAAGKGPLPRPHRNCLYTKAGDLRWLLWHDAKGPGDLVIGTGRDVTSLHLARIEIDRKEQEFRAVFERSSDGMLILNSRWEYEEANPAACAILGVPKQQILGKKHGSVVESVAIPEELRNQAIASGSYSGETELKRPDGEKRQVEFSIVANFREGHHLAVLRDISDRRRMERQLDQANKLEAVGQLAGGIAHDFNNMLTAIRGYCELLIKQLPDGKHRKYLDGILGASQRAEDTTRRLLAFSRRQVLQPKLLDLNESVRGALDLLRRVIGEDVELLTLLSENTGKVVADPGQLSQVLMNLAVNSRDAMPNGGKLIIETRSVYLDDDYSLRHLQVQPGPYALLAVTDTGTGIPSEVREHMFDPFFTTKEQGKGTGLGLAMVYGIVKQSGGYIWVYSEPGEGSTFKIYLPSAFDESGAGSSEKGAARKILVIEDDAQIRAYTRDALRQAGYEVLEAADGRQVLALCESAPELDLVLTDVNAPGMSGEDLMGFFAVKYPGVSIVHMSGFPLDRVAGANPALRFAYFLPKPFSIQQLHEIVAQALEHRAGPPPGAPLQ
jgi:PAS domain S-box-containing protein